MHEHSLCGCNLCLSSHKYLLVGGKNTLVNAALIFSEPCCSTDSCFICSGIDHTNLQHPRSDTGVLAGPSQPCKYNICLCHTVTVLQKTATKSNKRKDAAMPLMLAVRPRNIRNMRHSSHPPELRECAIPCHSRF